MSILSLTSEVRALPFAALSQLMQATYDVPMMTAVPEARSLLVAYLSRHPEVGSWQEAWNALTGATPTRTGILTIPVLTCQTCNGRGYVTSGSAFARSFTHAARTGAPAGTCPECHGTRNSPSTHRVAARYVPVPAHAQ